MSAVPTPLEYLDSLYATAMSDVGSRNTITSSLSDREKRLLDLVLLYSEQAKAALAVVFTSLVYKKFNPSQDIRKHQASIKDGYSGRTFDAKNITPFLKSNKFPSMQSGSGWLTRSFEQKQPFDKTYPGAINPKDLKAAFLDIIDNIENGSDCENYLSYLLQGLILNRNKQDISLAKPTALSIHTILTILDLHFASKYKAEGASRLPVLAIYAAYQCLTKEVKRFENKTLQNIESHTTSDKSSGRIGDIDIIDEKGREFEAVEVKFGIPITLQIVQDAYIKFQTTPVSRYYILSTATTEFNDIIPINEEISKIKKIHGCQVIVNGIRHTLKYYLRLLNDPYDFIENYVNLLETDTALKFEHRQKWNEIISELK